MEQNMTALVSLFARAYHQKSKDIKIFDDPLSTKLITKKEYEMIRLSMSQGISFFNPNFKGSKEEAFKVDCRSSTITFCFTKKCFL